MSDDVRSAQTNKDRDRSSVSVSTSTGAEMKADNKDQVITARRIYVHGSQSCNLKLIFAITASDSISCTSRSTLLKVTTTHHTLIEGATVIVYDDDVDSFKSLPSTSVLIAGDAITAIFPTGEDQSIPDDAEVIDAMGEIVSPGFVDTHHHGWQTAYRTIAADSHIAGFFVPSGMGGRGPAMTTLILKMCIWVT